MDNERCTCTDCAEQNDFISEVQGDYTKLWIVTDATKAHEAARNWEGQECELEHNHAQSRSCQELFQCDNCTENHISSIEAMECCGGWECNFCGQVHHGSDSYYSSSKDNAASCCITQCDDCDKMGWPAWVEDHTCSGRNPGMRDVPAWEDRGVKVDSRNPQHMNRWEEAWGFDFKQFDVVRAAADYYLLEAISSGLCGTVDSNMKINRIVLTHPLMVTIQREAVTLMNELVQVWDPVFQAYVHMAVGGELRHHTAVGNRVLSGSRDIAWVGWKDVFAQVGPQALADAAELFLEFQPGAFGGKPWADACLILHKRLTGKINGRMFLDRIFNAQHNGGCLMNKVMWAGDSRPRQDNGQHHPEYWSLQDLTYTVLPAHGASPEPDYPTLLAYASPEVAALFADSHRYGRKARLEMGLGLTTMGQAPRRGLTRKGVQAKENAAYAKTWAASNEPDYEPYEDNEGDYDYESEDCTCCN